MNRWKESRGMGILDVAQVTFIVLKAAGVIQWSWWAVLTPTWIVLIAMLSGGE